MPLNDPFADPIIPPSTHPTVASFRGRLAMFTVRKSEMTTSSLKPGPFERLTVDVTVVDGRGPVPLMKGNPPTPTGATLDGPDFTGMWIDSEYIVSQLSPMVGTGIPVLGIIDTKTPGTNPGKGNPWGIIAATPEQKQAAINFLNTRAVGGAAAPAPVAHQATPQAAAAAPSPAPTPQAALPAPGSAPQGANPFL